VTALRPLLLLAFALAVVVVGTSATLRLAANGIGCAPWPACYGRAATAAAANATPLARALRLSHRIAASAFALVAVAAVAIGWRRWATGQRIAGVALLAVTAVLAWIGRYTPSPLPAITLVNLLGGFSLLALLAGLLAAPATTAQAPNSGARYGRTTTAAVGVSVLLVAVAVQSAGGALISARLAGDACASRCGPIGSADAVVLLDPSRPGTATELAGSTAGQVLQAGHRLGGLALALLTMITVYALGRRRRPRLAAAAMLAAGVTGGLGFALASDAPALAAAAAHALGAGALCAALGAAYAVHAGAWEEVRT
jgi:cytochrome c oxidase assembly protein subunit 15